MNKKYNIGYEYENKYGKFKIIDIKPQYEKNIYVVVCQKCGHMVNKSAWEIEKERKCLGCVHNMEYSLYNIGEIINGLKILAKVPTVDKRGYVKKEYLCECVIDGKQVQIRESHLKNGVGCMECAGKKRGERQRKPHDIYIEEMLVKNPFIQVTGIYIDQNTKIKYICKTCGYMGESLPNNLLRGGGCPACKMSNGEKRVAKYLTDRNIKFETGYTFKDCKNVFALPFDFYLPEYNICIEYDGEQHFEPVEYFGGQEKFQKQKHNDLIKEQYCKNNNIDLCRIKYDQCVSQVLDKYLSKIPLTP